MQSALASLDRAQGKEDLLRHGLSQQSDAAYQSALASYQQGRGDLTSILDAARRRQEIRLEVLRIETEAQTAFAAIERLVGGER
jgi:cobalt-zinc-cadmium efflux system outer membrane protein